MLALDIGGTTAKCSLIEGGEVKIMSDYWIERSRRSAGYPIMVPVVDLVEIGNGGGSIAWVDDFGKLHVGPQSAGAVPGPGGLRPRRHRGRRPPTPTSRSAASTRTTSAAARSTPTWPRSTARSARSPNGSAIDRDEAARGIVRIANNNMVNALKLVSLNRGYDPRDFTLVAFGGGGGMHAVALAAELGMRRVVIPCAADVFSAWGMMMCDLRRDYFVTRLARLDAGDARGASTPCSPRSTDGALAQFAAEGVDAAQVRLPALRQAALREPGAQRRGAAARRPDRRRRGRRHRRGFHAHLRARIHLPARRPGRVRRHAPRRLGRGRQAHAGAAADQRPRSLEEARKGRRDVDYATEGVHEADIYDGDLLEPGMRFTGPAIVETRARRSWSIPATR